MYKARDYYSVVVEDRKKKEICNAEKTSSRITVERINR